MYGVAPVGVLRVVKIDDIERWRLLTVALLIVQHMVVCNKCQVGLLVIVYVEPEALFNLLLDEIVDYGIRLARTGSAEDDCSPEWINNIYPPTVTPFLIIELRGQIYGVVIVHQFCFLHEALVFIIETVVHHVVLQKPAHIHSADKHQYIAYHSGQNVRENPAKSRHPPVEEEQSRSRTEENPNMDPLHFLVLHAFRTHA